MLLLKRKHKVGGGAKGVKVNSGGTKGRVGSKCYQKIIWYFQKMINILKSPILFYLFVFKMGLIEMHKINKSIETMNN